MTTLSYTSSQDFAFNPNDQMTDTKMFYPYSWLTKGYKRGYKGGEELTAGGIC